MSVAEMVEEVPVLVPHEILVVEDETRARRALKSLLTSRGFEVITSNSGTSAIVEARRNNVGVVLMDIVLGDEIDGIEAAEAIQKEHPSTSFIFVTAYADEPSYQVRVRESGIRVGGWVPKPFKINDLAALIEREQQRVEMLTKATAAGDRGIDPLAYVVARADCDRSFPRDIMAQIREEFEAAMGTSAFSNPSPAEREIERMATLNAEIDQAYERIRQAVVTYASASDLQEILRPLRVRLRELHEVEADLLEGRFRSHLCFDAKQAEKREARAKRLLEEA